MINEIFPQFYSDYFDEEFHTYKKELISLIDELSAEDGRTVSNKGGWQSENYHPKFKPEFFKNEYGMRVVDFILSSATSLLNPMFAAKISGLWINVNPPGSYNEEHIHPNCLLSGVFYVRVPENSGNLTFVNSSEQRMPLSPFLSEHTIDSDYEVKPYDGQMILFRSDLRHKVGTNQSQHNRISIAFNLEVALKTDNIT